MSKKYHWLKLKGDFFTQPKIKKLRKIAGGDTYTIIYLKLQLLSLNNDGKIFFEGIEENFEEELALTLDEDVENVKVTIMFLMSQGLIEEVSCDEFVLYEAMENIGSKSAGKNRVKAYRERNNLRFKRTISILRNINFKFPIAAANLLFLRPISVVAILTTFITIISKMLIHLRFHHTFDGSTKQILESFLYIIRSLNFIFINESCNDIPFVLI